MQAGSDVAALPVRSETGWTAAVDSDAPRDGADVAELTGLLNLTGRPASES